MKKTVKYPILKDWIRSMGGVDEVATQTGLSAETVRKMPSRGLTADHRLKIGKVMTDKSLNLPDDFYSAPDNWFPNIRAKVG